MFPERKRQSGTLQSVLHSYSIFAMSQISSSTLFHFTKKKEFLQSILCEGFWPRYCIEYCWNGNHWAIPMVCFCDIPLSLIKEHIKTYGGEGWGIGMSKQWAIEQGITPVLYSSFKSDVYKLVYRFSNSLTFPSTNSKKMPLEELLLYRIKRTTASEKEQLLINGAIKRKKFYNEREWRFIPEITNDVHMEKWDNSQEANKEEFCMNLSEKTKNHKLKAIPDHINYIIVPNDEKRTEILKFIKQKFDCGIQSKLASRILTKENILKDF